MRFTDKGRSRGYLHGVLLDGRKPFLYRRGVRSLLGVPDGGVGVTYAPPLPPAGFQYVHRAGPDAPRPGSPDGDHEVVKEYPDRILRSIDAEERATDDVSPVEHLPAAPVAMRLPAERGRASRESDRTMHASPAVRDVPPHISPAVHDAPPHAAPASTTSLPDVKPGATASESFEVPGISRGVRDFPALRSTVAPEELAVRRDESKGAVVKDRPAEPDGARTSGEHAYAKDVSPVSPPPQPPASMPRAHKEKETGRGAGVQERSDDAIVPVEENMSSIERAREQESVLPSTRRTAQMPARIRSTAARGEAVEEGPYLEPADPTAGALSIRGALDGGRGARRAEGVEQIVERVIARRASEEGWDGSARRHAPEPPPRVVVVENRAQAGSKIPCAFWERSYLHRFRIRTLR